MKSKTNFLIFLILLSNILIITSVTIDLIKDGEIYLYYYRANDYILFNSAGFNKNENIYFQITIDSYDTDDYFLPPTFISYQFFDHNPNYTEIRDSNAGKTTENMRREKNEYSEKEYWKLVFEIKKIKAEDNYLLLYFPKSNWAVSFTLKNIDEETAKNKWTTTDTIIVIVIIIAIIIGIVIYCYYRRRKQRGIIQQTNAPLNNVNYASQTNINYQQQYQAVPQQSKRESSRLQPIQQNPQSVVVNNGINSKNNNLNKMRKNNGINNNMMGNMNNINNDDFQKPINMNNINNQNNDAYQKPINMNNINYQNIVGFQQPMGINNFNNKNNINNLNNMQNINQINVNNANNMNNNNIYPNYNNINDHENNKVIFSNDINLNINSNVNNNNKKIYTNQEDYIIDGHTNNIPSITNPPKDVAINDIPERLDSKDVLQPNDPPPPINMGAPDAAYSSKRI